MPEDPANEILRDLVEKVIGQPEELHAELTRDLERLKALLKERSQRYQTQESDEKFRSIFENAPFAIVLTRLVDGVIVDVNPAGEALFGYPREDVIGKTTLELDAIPDPQARQKGFEEMHTSGRLRGFEMVYRAKNGMERLISHNADRICIDGVDHILTTMENITARRQMVEELRRSEEKFRTLFTTIDEGFCIIEVLFDEASQPYDYRILEANPAFIQQTGLPDAIGKRIKELAPKHEQHWFDIYGQVALSGKPTRFINEAKQFGRWYDVYAFRMGDPQEHQVAVLFSDITKSKLAELTAAEDLRDTRLLQNLSARLVSEQNPQVLYEEILSAAIILTHAGAGTLQLMDEASHELVLLAYWGFEPGQIRQYSRVSAGQIRPYDAAQASGGPTLIPADDPGGVGQEGIRRMHVEAGYRSSQFTPLVTRSGRLIGMLSTCWNEPVRELSERDLRYTDLLARQAADLIERAQAQNSLRASEAHLRVSQAFITHLVDTSFEGIWSVDLTGKTTFLNQRAAEILGYSLEEILNQSPFEFLMPQDQDLGRQTLARIARGESGRAEAHARHKDGRDLWLLVAFSPIAGENGQLLGALAMFDDITESKHRELALHAAAARDAFRVQLSDALRPLSTTLEIFDESSRLLKDFLAADRVYYVEIDKDGEHFFIQGEHHLKGLPGLAGRYRMNRFGLRLMSEISNGRVVAIADVNNEPELTPEDRNNYAALNVHAFIAAPFRRDVHSIGYLAVHHSAVRKWTAEEIALVQETAERTWAEVEQARAEEYLRSAAARDAFRASLADALRPLIDPVAIQAAAARLLGEHLHAGRVHYAEVAEDQDTILILTDYRRRGFPSIVGQLSFNDYGEYVIQSLIAGRTLAVADVNQVENLTNEQLTAYAELRVMSYIVTPLIRGGKLRAVLAIHHKYPHEWSDEEVALVEETAGRTWEAVERAKAEQSLRESEAHLRRAASRDAYRVWLGDTLRPLTDPDQVLAAALRVLGHHTKADQVIFAEILGDEATIGHEYKLPDRISLVGQRRLDTFGDGIVNAFRSGRLLSVANAGGPGIRHEDQNIFISFGLEAYVLVPLNKNGEWAALLGVFSANPRDWASDDVELIKETAERTWESVERSRAEAELHASEHLRAEVNERFRSSVESINEAFILLSPIRTDGKIVGFNNNFINQEACRLFNRTLDQMVGHSILELFQEEKNYGLLEKLIRVVEDGQSLQTLAEFVFQPTGEGQPGSKRTFDIRASKFQDGLILTGNDITEQIRLAAEHAEAIKQKEIHHRLAEQREMERQSYARDIHDGPIQTLSSLAFNLQYVKEVYTYPALRVELDQIGLSIKNAVQELRQVINELRPPAVIRFGLAKAIRVHAENLRERYPHVRWQLDLDDDHNILPEQTCLALFRIYQEAVTNIIRHSEASQARISFRVRPGDVILEVVDNGKGFDHLQDIAHLTNNQHFGLAGIQERVESIGGEMAILTAPGGGTILRIQAQSHKP